MERMEMDSKCVLIERNILEIELKIARAGKWNQHLQMVNSLMESVKMI